MIFKNKKHEECYDRISFRMTYSDCYHAPVAYLIALDPVLRTHSNEVYHFYNGHVYFDVLKKPWQTSSSKKTTRLLLNLFCEFCADNENIGHSFDDTTDEHGFKVSSGYFYTPVYFFNDENAPYYWQAIQLCFGREEVKE